MVDVLTGTSTVKEGHAQMLKGGVIMDVESNEVVLTGLSMPHSPRFVATG